MPTVVFVIVNAICRAAPGDLRGGRQRGAAGRLPAGRRQSVQQALSGLFGVAIAAFIAYRTGQARGYFLSAS